MKNLVNCNLNYLIAKRGKVIVRPIKLVYIANAQSKVIERPDHIYSGTCLQVYEVKSPS